MNGETFFSINNGNSIINKILLNKGEIGIKHYHLADLLDF